MTKFENIKLKDVDECYDIKYLHELIKIGHVENVFWVSKFRASIAFNENPSLRKRENRMTRFLFRFVLFFSIQCRDFLQYNALFLFIAWIVLILFIGAAAIGLASAGTTEAIHHVSRY